jgi:hypothetical protein
VRPPTVHGELVQVPVSPPGLLVAVYCVIVAPPLNAGAVKLTVACCPLVVTAPIVGAPGTTALIANCWLTCGAALYVPSPPWFALMVQLPVVMKVSAPPLVIVQMPVVLDVKLTVRPELAVAVKVGVVPKFCVPGLLNVIVCVACGVALLEAADGAPVPAEFVAVTVNV